MAQKLLKPNRSKLELFFLIFPALYLADLFLGFNVHIITIPGIPGANILLAIFSLYAYALYAFLRSGPVSVWKAIKKHFGLLDLLVLAFIFLNSLWFTLVPVVTGSSLSMALNEGRAFLALFMYFPCVYLVRTGYISLEKILSFVFVLTMILAALHIVLYTGEKIAAQLDYDRLDKQGQEAGGFSRAFFNVMDKIRMGNTSGIPQIIMGHGYIRVIYPTSVLLLLGVYLTLRQMDRMRPYHYALFALLAIAICTTLAKTLWLGIMVGTLVYLACVPIFLKRWWKEITILMLTGLIVVMAANFFLFDGMVAGRISNTFSTEAPAAMSDVPNEASGTAESNQIRIKQTETILKEWRKSPVIGHGYGHYVKDYIRSKDQPFSYEMLFPSLLMKIGVLGVLVWGAFFIFVFVAVLKLRKEHPVHAGALTFVLVCLTVSVQNNPLLLNFNGMTFMVILLSDAALMYDKFTVAPHKSRK